MLSPIHIFKILSDNRFKKNCTGPEQQLHDVTWQPHPVGYLKCNIDAAIFTAD